MERESGTEKFIDTLRDREKLVYRYMREEYEKITNNDNDYDAELNDQIVANKAERVLGIPAEEAREMYVSVGYKVADYKERRASE